MPLALLPLLCPKSICGPTTRASCAGLQPLPEGKELAKEKHLLARRSRECNPKGVANRWGSLAVKRRRWASRWTVAGLRGWLPPRGAPAGPSRANPFLPRHPHQLKSIPIPPADVTIRFSQWDLSTRGLFVSVFLAWRFSHFKECSVRPDHLRFSFRFFVLRLRRPSMTGGIDHVQVDYAR